MDTRRKVATDVFTESRKYNVIEERLFPAFFEALETTGRYSAAARSVGWSIVELDRYRKQEPEFQELCDQALHAYNDKFVVEAQRRAIQGTKRPIVGGRNRDEVVAYERQYSDRLMELFLKRGDPTFSEKQKIEVSGDFNIQQHMDLRSLTPRAREKLRELLIILKEDREIALLESAEAQSEE